MGGKGRVGGTPVLVLARGEESGYTCPGPCQGEGEEREEGKVGFPALVLAEGGGPDWVTPPLPPLGDQTDKLIILPSRRTLRLGSEKNYPSVMACSNCTEPGPGAGWEQDQEQWVTMYYAELFTLHWDLEQDQTYCLLLCQSRSRYLSRSRVNVLDQCCITDSYITQWHSSGRRFYER